MTPRLAGLADLDAVVALTERAYAPYISLLGYPPLPVTADYAPRIAAGEVWLLDDVAALLGLIVLEETDDALSIFSIVVEPGRQRAGIGRQLLAFAESEAARRGRSVLTLYTNTKMTRNIDVYRRYGFAETGRRPNPKRPGFTIVDMEKPVMPNATARTA